MRKNVPAMAFAIALTAPPLMASGPGGDAFDELHTALSGGTPKLDLRYRYEDVDSDPGFQGNASTLRTALSYETGSYKNLRAFLEFEATINVLDHVSNSVLGVGDPSGGSVNQFFVSYDGVDNLAILAGRREIMLDNERFVGNIDWRQNHQAIDGITFQYTGVENLVASYVYVTSHTTTFAADLSHDGTHLFNVSYDVLDVGKVTTYWYRFDFESAALSAFSTDTMGVRFAGDVPVGDLNFNYVTELARQEDHGNNPTNVSEHYLNLEAGVSVAGVDVNLQFERMGGSRNGGRGEFLTPAADFHVHNGLADAFAGGTVTGAGLEDLNVRVSGEYAGIGWAAAVHFFGSNADYTTPVATRDEYGEEFDLELTYALNDQVDVGLLFANFNGFNVYSDVSKLAVWMSYRIL